MTDGFSDTDYRRMHESAAHVKLRGLLPPVPVREFVHIGEAMMDFVLDDPPVAVYILDETHDHTDSYHIEAEIKKAAEKAGMIPVFIEERELFEVEEKVRVKLENIRAGKERH